MKKMKVSQEVAEALNKQEQDEWTKQFNLIAHCKAFSGNGVKGKDIYSVEFKALESLKPLDYARCLIAGYEVMEEEANQEQGCP